MKYGEAVTYCSQDKVLFVSEAHFRYLSTSHEEFYCPNGE